MPKFLREIKHPAMSIQSWIAKMTEEEPTCVPVKSFFLSSKNRFVFLTIPADKRLNMTALSRFTGVSRPPFRVVRAEKYEEVLGVKLSTISLHTALDRHVELKVPFQFLFDDSFRAADAKPLIACPSSEGSGSLIYTLSSILEGVTEVDKDFMKKGFFAAVESETVAAPPAAEPSEEISRLDLSMKGTSYSKLGIEVTKEDNFVEWYVEVLKKAELLEYYDVSGCYILRPWGYAIWEIVKDWFDARIKAMGVENCYFPILITKAALQREVNHIDGFAPEVAWVTKSGDCEFAEPIAIRPTSETAMYPTFAKWIRSHRDLPLKLNQWSNVLRWEFSHPTPFIRSREFLWQEGHTAWETAEEATREALEILELYRELYEKMLAVPVVKGRKTDKERFPGADTTWSVEALITQPGRGCQAATSHFLGQNFARMFEIEFENANRERQHVYQNSWGFTTRSIGIMIMTHSDSKGLVLPPRVGKIQIVIVPCGMSTKTTPEEKENLMKFTAAVNAELCAEGVRSHVDSRTNVSVGWKFNHWELKGVPLRLEVGPKELVAQALPVAVRYTGEKEMVQRSDFARNVRLLLDSVHDKMLACARSRNDERTKLVHSWESFNDVLREKGFPLAPHCGGKSCEEYIKAQSAELSRERAAEDKNAPSMGAKSLCVPLDQPSERLPDRCISPVCENTPLSFTLFGRSY
ncbi:prolyl-tRNA synthetase [Perkinsela sp. CCAP 1560/4]|nr:prolyl-tRNA synthetase [Perkinsela sp. CCAP 1560/4]|eukprot:KNH04277.1 prolyl-tRNA synthetase [Perkinsela sp. CCAP 1560/4]